MTVVIGCAEHSESGEQPGATGSASDARSAGGDPKASAGHGAVSAPHEPKPSSADSITDPNAGAAQAGGGCAGDVKDRIHVAIDGVRQTPTNVEQGGEWLNSDGAEVFRLTLEAYFDPRPGAVDDEFSLTATLDLMPAAVAKGLELEFAQHIDVVYPSPAGSQREPPAVTVTLAPGQTAYVRRAMLSELGFWAPVTHESYDAKGKLAPRWTDREQGKLSGTFELTFEGGFVHGSREVRFDGCLDLALPLPKACLPGDACGNDCYGPEDYVCGACGELYYTHDCSCRPDVPPLSECASTEPAGEGELCGHYWWCDRGCGSGLTCREDPSFGQDSDAGVADNAAGCTYFTCQR